MTGAAGGPSSEQVREAMGRLATGVVIVTSWVEARPWGITVSSCCSLSMQPVLLLVALATRTASTRMILESGGFGVSILARDQADQAQRARLPPRSRSSSMIWSWRAPPA